MPKRVTTKKTLNLNNKQTNLNSIPHPSGVYISEAKQSPDDVIEGAFPSHEESHRNRKADSSSKPKTCGVESSSSHILHYVKRLVYMFLAQSSCGKLDI
jgi:hypothetical protein